MHLMPDTVQHLTRSQTSLQPFPQLDRTVYSQSRMFLVSYNLYPGLIQDDLGGPPTLESIQSGPALAYQSGAGTYEPGLRFLQDWGGTHIGFLVP